MTGRFQRFEVQFRKKNYKNPNKNTAPKGRTLVSALNSFNKPIVT
jgi:hypothetical protein